MGVEFKLPEVGEGVTSADISGILVKVGDLVEADQAVIEIETEKSVVELPSPVAGRIEKIHVSLGQSIPPGTPLLTIDAATKANSNSGPAPSSSTPENHAPKKDLSIPKTEPNVKTPLAPVTTPFVIPDIGEGVKEADISGVLVKVGDIVEVGQSLFEVETEKSVAEVPSNVTGKILEVRIKPGDHVKPGDTVLMIETAGTLSSTSQTGAPAPAPERPAVSVAAPASKEAGSTSANSGSASAKSGSSGLEAPMPVGTLVAAGPATRRLARELGVDLRKVKGTGRNSRIQIEDVHAYVREALTKVSKGGGGTGTGIEIPPLPDFALWGSVERKPMSKIHRTTANNLSLAWQIIPHVTQHELADVTELEAGRKRHVQSKGGAKITMTVLALKAVVATLKQFPHFNSSIDTRSNEVIYKNYYHIGVAVDTEAGLVVPVIRDVNQKSILEIAKELELLAEKARQRKLMPADLQGGTFTITNLGGIGGTYFSPIVNYPEVAILGMCRSRQQMVIYEGKPEVRLMLPLSLSYDHRVINGADAARFVVKVAGLLADPSQLLIES